MKSCLYSDNRLSEYRQPSSAPRSNARGRLNELKEKVMRRSILGFWRVWLCVVMLASLPVSSFGHGGEDHGDAKAPAVSTSANMVARTVRAGDYEVTLKHPPIEPDKETTARVFVTRFDSNEPVENATITLLFSGGEVPIEATATAGNTAGMYEVKLPPMREGEYKLAARIGVNGTTETVEYGALQVAPAPATAAESESSWARMALIALASLVGLGFIAFVLYRASQYTRRDRTRETATA